MANILTGIGAIAAALVAGAALYFSNRTTNANLRSQREAHQTEIASRRQEARDQRLWEAQVENYIALSSNASYAIVWSFQPSDPKAQASELAAKLFAALTTTRVVGRQTVVDSVGLLTRSLIDVESAAEGEQSELKAGLERVRVMASNVLEQIRIATGASDVDIEITTKSP